MWYVQGKADCRVFIKDFVQSQALVGSVLYLTSVLSSTHHRSFSANIPPTSVQRPLEIPARTRLTYEGPKARLAMMIW